ncbi:MAG: carbohydrate kinase family protein [Christensenellales bacterium]
MDVLCVGIAALDIYARPVTDQVFQRETMRVEQIGISGGGDALNQAVVLRALGSRSALIARIGKDSTGDILMERVEAAGVDVSMVCRSMQSTTTTAIALVGPDGRRNILNVKGGNYDFDRNDIHFDKLPEARALSVGSIFGLQALERDGGLLDLLRLAKDRGMLTFADMSSDKLGQRIGGVLQYFPYLDYYMPSAAEAEAITGERQLLEQVRVLREHGCGNLLIKLGGDGVYLGADGYDEVIPAYSVCPIDTTGAGDTFCAAFIHGKLRGYDTKKACCFAAAAGALSTQYAGASASPPSEQEVLDMMGRE